MSKTIKNIIRNSVPKRVKEFFAFQTGDNFARKSYAVSGEDLILAGLLDNKSRGRFLEIGANHPFRFSNTYYFYKLGWSGICIDPLSSFQKDFKTYRSRDMFVNVALGSPGELMYYQFSESAFNTTNPKIAEGVCSKLIKKEIIPILELKTILSENYSSGFTFDFASIDVEGNELDILQSHDWENFPIKIICIEIHEENVINAMKNPLSEFLLNKNYIIVAKNRNNLFFKHYE